MESHIDFEIFNTFKKIEGEFKRNTKLYIIFGQNRNMILSWSKTK